MCIIIDANIASQVFGKTPHDDFAPLIKWLYEKDGCMVFGGKNSEELSRIGEVRRQIVKLNQAGRALLYNKEDVDAEENAVVSTRLCVSDDPHVVALARISGARTLCSKDNDLHADFRNHQLISNPRGGIYQNTNHERLLRHTSSCSRG